MEKLFKENVYVFILLIFNFLYRLFIYYNTNLFDFADHSNHLAAMEAIKETGQFTLGHGGWLYLISYIGYFCKYNLGNFDYFFVLNSLVGTMSTFFLYIFIMRTINRRDVGLIYLISASLYSEYIALSSIFYTQVIETLISSVLINLLLSLHRSKIVYRNIIIILSITILLLFSFFFKPTLRYFWVIIFSISLFNIQNRQLALKYFILAVTIISVNLSIKIFNPQFHSIISGMDVKKSYSLIFWGHTLYGGDGGEATFIYAENKQKYNINYNNWLNENNMLGINNLNEDDFRKDEIKRFVTNHPLMWLKLQIYKFSRTFGIVPEGQTFTILYSGLFQYNWFITALYLQIPFFSFIMLIIFLFDIKVVKKYCLNRFFFTWVIFFSYWITAIVFYQSFQERYRIPVMVIFLLPVFSLFISDFKIKNMFKGKIAILKCIVLSVVLLSWVSQAYNVLVVRKERYFGFVNRVSQSDDPSSKIEYLWKKRYWMDDDK